MGKIDHLLQALSNSLLNIFPGWEGTVVGERTFLVCLLIHLLNGLNSTGWVMLKPGTPCKSLSWVTRTCLRTSAAASPCAQSVKLKVEQPGLESMPILDAGIIYMWGS